jgi:hypothetical protein
VGKHIKTIRLMIEEKNEVWERMREATLKFLWLRVVLLLGVFLIDIFWLTKEQTYFSKQIDAIIFSVGFGIAIVIGLWVFFDISIFWSPRPMLSNKEIDAKVERQSGKVLIQNDVLIWQDSEGKLIGEIPLDKVKVIGEYTTSDGPLVDDWFYLFILSQTDLRQVSAYATTLSSVLESISLRYNCEIVGHLSHSTTFQSNILWPSQLKGQKVYDISMTTKPMTIWEKLRLSFGQTNEVELTNDLKTYLS